MFKVLPAPKNAAALRENNDCLGKEAGTKGEGKVGIYCSANHRGHPRDGRPTAEATVDAEEDRTTEKGDSEKFLSLHKGKEKGLPGKEGKKKNSPGGRELARNNNNDGERARGKTKLKWSRE